MNIALICPSRGRPDEARLMKGSAYSTSSGNVRVFFLVDSDDPKLDKYPEGDKIIIDPQPASMNEAVRRGLQTITRVHGEYDIYGFIGDDVRFTSLGWDEAFRRALSKPGIAYGDDGLQGEKLATHWFVSGSIVKRVGLVPAPTNHFYTDNAWTDVGKELHCLRYLPEVKTEHLHFTTKKSKYDETYQRSDEKFWKSGVDEKLYNEWRYSPQWEKFKERVRAGLWQ